MRILLIAPYLPPYNNPRSSRWGAIINVWKNEGHEVDVISGKHPNAQGDDKNGKLQVYRPSFPSLADRRRVNLDQSNLQLKPLRWLYRTFLKSWQWPDQCWIWIKPATEKAIQLTKIKKYDLLISVSLPFSAHLVARRIKEKNANLNWTADIGDPFSLQKMHFLNNRLLFAAKNLNAEKELFNKVNQIIVTSSETKKLYLKKFDNGLNNKINIIPPLSDFTSNIDQKPTLEKDSIIRIGYFGRFFPGVRDVIDFIPAINKINTLTQVSFHFYGDTSGLLPTSSEYKTHSQLSKKQLPQAIKQMDILLSLGNTTDYQLPSKIADYLSSGKPILHIAQLEEDAVITLTKNYAGVFTLLNKELDNSSADLLSFIKSATQKPYYERDITSFRSEEIARKYLFFSRENN